MKDAAYYRWLDSPFTAEEQAELARIERKHQLGQEVANQIALVAEQLHAFRSARSYRQWSILTPKAARRAAGRTWRLDSLQFSLTAGESEYWPQLLEKQRRPIYLSQFRYDPEAENGFIARLKREMPAGGDIKKYLSDEISLFSQRHAAFLASFEPDEQGQDRRPPDMASHYLIVESRERRAKEFRQYVAAELDRLSEKDAPAQGEAAPINLKSAEKDKQQPLAKLAPGIEASEVRTLLDDLKMGTSYNKPGEWAAALRALYLGNVLRGSCADEISRWAISQGYITKENRETVRTTWKEEWSQTDQFRNKAQRRVFEQVKESSLKLLESKTKTGSNN